MATDMTGFNRFMKKLNNVKQIVKENSEILNKLVYEVARTGSIYLQNLYQSSSPYDFDTNSMPKVDTLLDKNKAYIRANGRDVAFIEFGVGIVGKEQGYKGNLPKTGVSKTDSWEYNYDSEFKFTSKSGKYSGVYNATWQVPKWVTGANINAGGFTHGRIAGNQIYDTAVYLKGEIPKIIKKVLQEELDK